MKWTEHEKNNKTVGNNPKERTSWKLPLAPTSVTAWPCLATDGNGTPAASAATTSICSRSKAIAAWEQWGFNRQKFLYIYIYNNTHIDFLCIHRNRQKIETSFITMCTLMFFSWVLRLTIDVCLYIYTLIDIDGQNLIRKLDMAISNGKSSSKCYCFGSMLNLRWFFLRICKSEVSFFEATVRLYQAPLVKLKLAVSRHLLMLAWAFLSLRVLQGRCAYSSLSEFKIHHQPSLPLLDAKPMYHLHPDKYNHWKLPIYSWFCYQHGDVP